MLESNSGKFDVTLAPAARPVPFTLSDAAYCEIEDVFRLDITDDRRAILNKVVDSYVRSDGDARKRAAASREALRKKLTRAIKKLESLIEELTDLDADGASLTYVGEPHPLLQDLIAKKEGLLAALTYCIPKRGGPVALDKRIFISNLADIFEGFGLRASAWYQPSIGQRQSPFLQFLHIVKRHLPREALARFSPGLSEMAYDVLHDRKRGGFALALWILARGRIGIPLDRFLTL